MAQDSWVVILLRFVQKRQIKVGHLIKDWLAGLIFAVIEVGQIRLRTPVLKLFGDLTLVLCGAKFTNFYKFNF